MKKFFTATFLKFFLSFVAILAVSFILIIVASSYKGQEAGNGSALTSSQRSA